MDGNKNRETGFAGIGKRIDDFKTGGGAEDATAWEQATAESQQQDKQESVKQETTQKVYTPRAEKKPWPSFRLSFAKVFWGIIAIAIIIASIFSQNNDKKKTTYTPSGGTSTPTSSPSFNDDDMVTVGQYRCSRYHHNRAEELNPNVFEKQDIERQQRILNGERDALDLLKRQIETDYVDNYSRDSVNQHNMLVSDYNSRLEIFRLNVGNMQRRIDNYNARVNNYNNYLINNCSKAY